MKKLLILYCLLVFANISMAQNCVKNISTNPENPVNDEFLPMMNNWYPAAGSYTVNSFLNTDFDWRYPNAIEIETSDGWVSPVIAAGAVGSTYRMVNPFESANGTQSDYVRGVGDPEDGDFHWEDGWELLWMNLGVFPNGDRTLTPSVGTYFDANFRMYQASPTNIPYFVLYNRYRGILRVFSNVWFKDGIGNFENVAVTLKYTNPSVVSSDISGVLRHVNSLDKAMDEYTSVTEIHSPRFHVPGGDQWFIADFQLAYDPCACISKGEFELVFQTFDDLDIEMVSRSVTLENQDISNYESQDFLNITGDILNQTPKEGSKIYKNMGVLLDKQSIAKSKYTSDLSDYESFNNQAKTQLLALAKVGFAGITSSNPLGPLAIQLVGNLSLDKKIKKPEDLAKSATKSLLGFGYDFLSTQLEVKSKPSPPSTPTASFTETYFKGKISSSNAQFSKPLMVPGSTSAYTGTQRADINPFNYPAYNENLGLFALTSVPEALIYEKTHYSYSFDYGLHPAHLNQEKKTYLFKINEKVNFKLNDAVDFDRDKTVVYASIELQLETYDELNSQIYTDINLMKNNSVKNSSGKYITTFNSLWIPVEDLGQELFEINLGQTNATYSSIKGIKLKLMADMYFQQANHFGEETNTTQVFTFPIYNGKANPLKTIDVGQDLDKMYVYERGVIKLFTQEIGPGSFVYSPTLNANVNVEEDLANNKIYIDAEEIIINGHVTAAPGWKVELRAKDKITLLDNSTVIGSIVTSASVGPGVSFFTFDQFYDVPKSFEMTSEEINTFCTGPDYRANSTEAVANGIMPELTEEELEQMELAEEEMYKTGPEEEETMESEILSVQVYPNPTSGSVKVKINNLLDENYGFKITDVNGKTLVNEQNRGSNNPLFEIDLQHLSPGFYFLEISTDQGFSEKVKLVIDK